MVNKYWKVTDNPPPEKNTGESGGAGEGRKKDLKKKSVVTHQNNFHWVLVGLVLVIADRGKDWLGWCAGEMG